MKKFFSGLLSSLFLVGIIAPAIPTHGAGTVVQFEIIAPATVKANEAFDVTVRAIDSEKNTVPSYRGSIIFASAVFGDTVPMQGKAIQFTAEDNGEKTFSKATSFKSPGEKEISVIDLNDNDLSGDTTINVLPADSGDNSGISEPITIISPENNTKITTSTVTVSGNTKKNSKINIMLNDVQAGTTTSDNDGIFTKTISGVTQQSNILYVEVLNSDGNVIGTSERINIDRADMGGSIYNVVVSPSTTVEASSPISITIEGDTGLASVSVTLDDANIPAEKTTGGGDAGIYIVNTIAPAKEGAYKISISATNGMGTPSTKDNVAEITVIPVVKPTSAFKNVQVLDGSGRAIFAFGLDNPPADLAKFQIAYGETPNGFGSGVTTYETSRILGTDGLYHWYVPGLEAKTYYFKVLGLKADDSIIENLSSDPISATIGKGTCTIGNVGTVNIQTLADKSILSWEAVPGAVSYNVYKVSAAGDQTLFQNVKENQYTLYLASGAVTYNDFAIKALCDDKTESSVPAVAVKVPTGPASIAFVVIISGILGAIILRRRAL